MVREAEFNFFSELDRQQAMIAAAYAAVAEHFSHIALRDIVDPPSHGYYDAFLARQLAWTIAIDDFGIPKKRLVKLQQYSLHTMLRAQRVVQERCAACPVFQVQYQKMAARAHALLQHKVEEAA